MTQGTFKFSRPSTSSTSVHVQASEDITSSWCPTLPPRSFMPGLGRPCSVAGPGLSVLRPHPRRGCGAWVLSCSVTLACCCDRWLSNNARFKCKPKGAFSEFFIFFECNKSVSLAFCNVCPWALQHSVGHLCCKPSFYAEHLAWRWCWKPSARPGCVPEPGDHLS